MRELAITGTIAIAFTLVSYYATRGPSGGELGWYAWANLVGGAGALLVAAALAVRRVQGFGSPSARRVLLPRVVWILGIVAAGVLLEGVAHRAGWRFDWTADARFELAPASLKACGSLDGPARATHFFERNDSVSRRTRFLLQSFEAAHCFSVRERDVEVAEAELDLFEVTSTNSVVIEYGEYYEVIERPTEGSILEALLRLSGGPERILYVAIGEGEGDLRSGEPSGYSGLREALATEGYVLKSLVTLASREIPDDADALLVIAPQRPLHETAIASIERYVERGGRVVVLLEPDGEAGLVALVAHFGIESQPELVVDARFADLEGTARGTGVLVSTYARHPITKGLEARHMSYFPGVRPVEAARKPEPDDRLEGILYSSPDAWLSNDVAAARRGIEPSRGDARLQRFALAVAGRYPRPGGEGRLVVFGDAEFASNRFLRALYNLDLIVNSLHWATERESAITLRPKMLTPYQTPLPPQTTLQMLYGVGLLVPEILLMIGAIVWIRRRSG